MYLHRQVIVDEGAVLARVMVSDKKYGNVSCCTGMMYVGKVGETTQDDVKSALEFAEADARRFYAEAKATATDDEPEGEPQLNEELVARLMGGQG